ncbi:MAG: ABC transporter permease [Anaerolineae bacterium]|nr:ABC transporter permease [Anaerolineae bacterium]
MSRSTPASASVEVPVVQLESKANNRTFFNRIRRMPRAWVGLALVLLVLLSAILAPMLTQLDPLTQFRDGLSDVGTPLPPNAQYILGTDHLGRDLWTRLLYGGQVSLAISIIANVTAAILGTLIGLLAGYYSGIIDSLLMRFTEVLLAFPAILLALGLGSVLRPSIPVVILILAVITWPTLARVVRSQVLSVRERQFIESARCCGGGDWYIIFQHILPHTITVTVVWMTLSIASSVLIEASLSYLGVGVPPPTPSWGNMISDGQTRYRLAPWMILIPTLAILLTTLGFNLLGDAVRDALDPRTSHRS